MSAVYTVCAVCGKVVSPTEQVGETIPHPSRGDLCVELSPIFWFMELGSGEAYQVDMCKICVDSLLLKIAEQILDRLEKNI